MDYSPFATKDSYRIASGDGSTKRLPNDISHVSQRPTGIGLSERGGSVPVDPSISKGAETSYLNLDASYKQKLRSGFIDFLNTINDNKYRGTATYSKAPLGFSGQEVLARSCDIPVYSAGDTPLVNHRERTFYSRSYYKRTDRKKLYRSNSSLELDHCYKDVGNLLTPLSKDYGSANSLDAVKPGGNNITSLLQTCQQGIENIDRLTKTDLINDTAARGGMIGSYGTSSSAKSLKMQQQQQQQHYTAGVSAFPSSPILCSIDASTTLGPEPPHSPKLDAKFQKTKESKSRNEGGGIFRKLRGVKSDPSSVIGAKTSADTSVKSDGCYKALSHYDCQSVTVRISDVIKRRAELSNDVNFKRLNVTTGASAASVTRIVPSNSATDLENVTSADESDIGDGKSNDLLLSCSYFHNELGGEEVRSICVNRSAALKRVYNSSRGMVSNTSNLITDPLCNGVAVLDTSVSLQGFITKPFLSAGGYVFEYIDNGAFYYRYFFNEYEHQNFFGMDENIGPVAISIRREKVFDSKASSEGVSGWFYQYRIIVRTSELTSLRGSVLEDNIPSSSRLSSAKGLLAKDILEFTVPNLNTSCLHQAIAGSKTAELLMKVDEQGISKAYKIGIMLCRAGQATEEEMYNNEFSSPAFDEFLNLISKRIKLKGFEHYRGGLDIKSDSTGNESFFTKIDDNEIMFHISTLLPFTPNNKQQLLRKRHIGNDIVTIIFQEPDALPFTPKSVRSQFQHVFIVVRAHHPNTENTRYSIAVSRSKNVPYFGPLIPEGAVFTRSEQFREFLLVKAINAENAVHKSDKFMAMAVRTRQEYLKDLAQNYVISSSIDSGSRLSKLTLGSGRKKDKARLVRIPDIHSKGAVSWCVHVEDFAHANWINCLIGISFETVVIVDESTSNVLFTTPCQSVIGWTMKPESNLLRLFHNQGECVHISAGGTEIKEIVSRLEVVSHGCQTEEKTLYRNSDGHLGFHICDGIVSDIDTTGPAYVSGLKSRSVIVEVCSALTATLTQDQLIDLLRTSKHVTISVIPPFEDGYARSVGSRREQDAGDGAVDTPKVCQQGNASWRHLPLDSSSHSSLERKDAEKQRMLMNNLRAASLENVATKVEGGGPSADPQVTFYSSYASQNAYKGSHLSLSHKSESSTSNAQRNSGGLGLVGTKTYSQTNSSSPRPIAHASAANDDLKQFTTNRMASNTRDHHYQLQASGDWYANDVPGKGFGPNLRSYNALNNEPQPPSHVLQHSQSSNKAAASPSVDHINPVRQQQSGPNFLASSDPASNDSRKFRKSAPTRSANSRITPSKSFQKDLIRLIDTEVPPSELSFQRSQESRDKLELTSYSQLHHSDDNICASSSSQKGYSSMDDSSADQVLQKMRSTNVVEIPGTIYRLQTSHSSAAIPLPVVSKAKDDWSSLVDAADRAFEGEFIDRSPIVGTLGHSSNHSGSTSSSSKTSSSLFKNAKSVDMANSGTQLQQSWKGTRQEFLNIGQPSEELMTDQSRIKELEARYASLDRQLQAEQKERAMLELELDQLRQDNIRLQEESQTAAAQLRKFTEWFFQTIDKR